MVAGYANRDDGKPMLGIVRRMMVFGSLLPAVPARQLTGPWDDSLSDRCADFRSKSVFVSPNTFASVLPCTFSVFSSLLWRLTPLPDPFANGATDILPRRILCNLCSAMRRALIPLRGCRKTGLACGRFSPFSFYRHCANFTVRPASLLAIFVVFIKRLFDAALTARFSLHNPIVSPCR